MAEKKLYPVLLLNDGTELIMDLPERLSFIDGARHAVFLLDTMDLCHGYSSGVIDDDGHFTITSGNNSAECYMESIPFDRLKALAYFPQNLLHLFYQLINTL